MQYRWWLLWITAELLPYNGMAPLLSSLPDWLPVPAIDAGDLLGIYKHRLAVDSITPAYYPVAPGREVLTYEIYGRLGVKPALFM